MGAALMKHLKIVRVADIVTVYQRASKTAKQMIFINSTKDDWIPVK